MSLSKSFKKDNVKVIANIGSDFNYDSNYKFYKLYKGYDEFEEMSLDSKHCRIKEFNKLLIKPKALKPRNSKTQLKKKWIIKNVDELYEKYYNFYKNDYGNDDELSEARKKNLTTNNLNCLTKQTKS